ncbi:hypothetical protein [Thermus tengchongensis]|uniref:hypothetical protein n=1 Tax=Thermus tengchongensis TaxID=1214928 RepID=UPI000B25E8DC|nr:hypothetical protein [Thermus tengchongensis]
MLNLNDWIALFKASLRDFQAGAYTIGRSLIVVGLIWSLIRAVYYGSLEEVLGAMARVVLAGGFLWFGEVLDESFGGTQGVYYAVTNTFRTELADAMTEAANNLKALGAVINPLFIIVAIVEAGVVHLVGTGLNDGTNMPDWAQQILAGIGAAAQLLNPASLLLVPFVIIAMVLTVLISTMFMLASAFWPIVAGSLALPIGLGPQLFGRWLSVVVWAFIMGAVGPFVVRGAWSSGSPVRRPTSSPRPRRSWTPPWNSSPGSSGRTAASSPRPCRTWPSRTGGTPGCAALRSSWTRTGSSTTGTSPRTARPSSPPWRAEP